jgi:hypothetical protein
MNSGRRLVVGHLHHVVEGNRLGQHPLDLRGGVERELIRGQDEQPLVSRPVGGGTEQSGPVDPAAGNVNEIGGAIPDSLPATMFQLL